MKTDLVEETENPPTPEADERIAWQPGMCLIEDCGHAVADGEGLCPPCAILFGPYAELIAHDDVTEWEPPKLQSEAEAPPEQAPAPTPAKRTRKRPPPVPPIAQPESS